MRQFAEPGRLAGSDRPARVYPLRMADDSPPTTPESSSVDPKAFLAALLRLSPEDAKRVRSASSGSRKRKPVEGPHHDYGNG